MISDERLREAYERGLAAGADREPLDDLAAERLRKVVDREGAVEDRLHTIDALLASRGGRQDLDIVLAAAHAARVPAWRRSILRIAALMLVVVGGTGVWMVSRDHPNAMRSEGSSIKLVQPAGRTPALEARRFTWRSVPEVARYVLIVVDSLGSEVFTGETSDTTLTLPAGVSLQARMTYLWWVQARTTLGSSMKATVQRLEVVN